MAGSQILITPEPRYLIALDSGGFSRLEPGFSTRTESPVLCPPSGDSAAKSLALVSRGALVGAPRCLLIRASTAQHPRVTTPRNQDPAPVRKTRSDRLPSGQHLDHNIGEVQPVIRRIDTLGGSERLAVDVERQHPEIVHVALGVNHREVAQALAIRTQ